MERKDFPFFHEIRVRYSEIDGQGIAYNSHYLTYFDAAVYEFFRHIGYAYKKAVEVDGLDYHVAKATVEYFKPIYFDELIEVAVKAGAIGNSSITWSLAIFRKDQADCVAAGQVIWVCAKVGAHKSHNVPKDLIELINNN